MIDTMTGLLWFDDSDKTLSEKINAAVIRYRQKWGEHPTVCYVHPSLVRDDAPANHSLGVEIRVGRAVLPHHFFVGVDTEATKLTEVQEHLNNQRGEADARRADVVL